MIMRKPELVRRLAKETRLSQRVVSDVVVALQRQVQDALKQGHTVELTGFGAFYTGERKERTVQDVRSKQKRTVPAHRYAAFRVGNVLKRALKPQAKSQAKRRRWFLGKSAPIKDQG